jgi:Lrp/AsnC family transcriptional regulator for asnA, asnC and gidA|tara:strand:- start:701 stop:1201 length:501 start_codon:yes stop_codon:yes gene_type:complete
MLIVGSVQELQPSTEYIPDELDLKIVALLQEDGRMSTQDIAGALDSTSSTIRKRIRRLEETGTMRVVAVTDFAAAGYDVLLAIGIEVESRSAEAVGLDLAALPEVFSVNLTTGSHDIEILVGARSFDELATFLHEEVSHIDGIGRLSPGLTVEVYKYQSEVVPQLE